MCIVANSIVTNLNNSIKVNQLEMWSPPASQGANVTCSVDWEGFNNSPNREFSDTSVSVATPAYVKCPPPPMSLASFWQLSSGSTLFTLTAPTGTIIDVHVSLILMDGESPVDTAVTSGAQGIVYFLSLDPNVTHRYTPVSLTTTT
jgi:hypothetical protein